MPNNTVCYGFLGIEHLFGDRITTTNASVVDTAIAESLAEYNRQKEGVLALFAQRVTDYTRMVWLPSQGTLQPLDKGGWGSPLPAQETGHYDVAWPVHGAGDAFGTNRVSRAKMTVGEANRQLDRILRNDADWIRRHALAAILDNVAWTFADDLYGNIIVEPLANLDAVTYVKVGGAAPSTDNHYLSTSGSGVATDFQTLYEELSEHPSNGTDPIVAYIPTANCAYVEAASGFVAADIAGISANVTISRFTADQARFKGPGNRVMGQTGHVVCVEWNALPTNYVIGVALSALPPLAMREYQESSLQGLFREDFTTDGNVGGYRMLRYCGFGGLNRIAAAVLKLGAGSYSIPTGYNAPLAV